MIAISTGNLLKKSYVRLVHSMRDAIRSGPSRQSLPGSGGRKFSIWVRSLLAIHDIDEMSRLDLAWWQLDALAEVDRFLSRRPGARVFEYGSGASTLWLSRRAGSVTSIEHDEAWYRLVRDRLKMHKNARLRLVPAIQDGREEDAFRSGKSGAGGVSFRDYVHAIDAEDGAFDLIVIDGRCRARCLEIARTRLKPDGMIVFDNSNRRRYRTSIETSGLASVRYRGLSACLPYPDETTLLRHP